MTELIAVFLLAMLRIAIPVSIIFLIGTLIDREYAARG